MWSKFVSIIYKSEKIVVFKVTGYRTNLHFQGLLWPKELGYKMFCKNGDPTIGPPYCTTQAYHWDSYCEVLKMPRNEYSQYWIINIPNEQPYSQDTTTDISDNENFRIFKDYWYGKGEKCLIGIFDDSFEIGDRYNSFPKNPKEFFTKEILEVLDKLLAEQKIWRRVIDHPFLTNIDKLVNWLKKEEMEIPETINLVHACIIEEKMRVENIIKSGELHFYEDTIHIYE